MSSSLIAAPSGDRGDSVRPLPAKPSLAFERKQAKAFVRQVRRGEPAALTRAGVRPAAGGAAIPPSSFTLADAQHLIAREYGFASWPRLVRYFRELAPQTLGNPTGYRQDFYDGRVSSLLAQHRGGSVPIGRALAAWVPRFYGQSVEQVLAAPVTLDDARIAVARQNHCTSWEHLLERAAAALVQNGQPDPWQRNRPPFIRAVRAMSQWDLPTLRTIVDDHPELLHPSEDDDVRSRTLVDNALILERNTPTPEARAVTDWLVSRGADFAGPLNRKLLGYFRITADQVEYLLDRGADPAWIPPNGVSVLEHAIVRYWNGEAVDLIARRVTPRRALWIAAGLGDVEGVRRYLDRNGKPTPAAFRERPPLGLMSPHLMPALPDPDPTELLLEAMLVAMLNGRVPVIKLLLECGLSVDYAGWGMPMACLAVGDQRVALVEALVTLGANLDLKGQHPHASAREMAVQRFLAEPENATARHILNLCDAGDPDQLLAEAHAKRQSPPPVSQNLHDAMALAGDDAVRRGQAEIQPENLFIGVLRAHYPLPYLSGGGVDLERLAVAIADRVLPDDDRLARPKLPLDSEAKASVARAVRIADARGRNAVGGGDLMAALLEDASGFAATLLVTSGGALSKVRERVGRY